MSQVPWGQFARAFKEIADRIISSLMSAPGGKKITKLGFWEDANGDLKYIKAYDSETLLFTLTDSRAGEATEETWTYTRTEA